MKQDNNSEQRREHQRITTCIPVIISAFYSSFKGMILNLSCGGVQCVLEEFLPLKTKVQVAFKLPINQFESQQIRLQGIVIRFDQSSKTNAYDNYKFAVQFSEVSPNEKKIIEDYIAERKKTSDNQLKDIYER
ncbi:MAG: PilZ domain-containing protein [Candidatus Kuenenia sp.]|nr:PilZ domain-containing protein [Candidatus Kuenenia hertensis]